MFSLLHLPALIAVVLELWCKKNPGYSAKCRFMHPFPQSIGLENMRCSLESVYFNMLQQATQRQVICGAYFVGHCLKYSSESMFSWEARKVIPSWGCGDREYITSHLSKGQLLPLYQARFLDSLRQNCGLILLLLLICFLPFLNILRGQNVTNLHHTEFTIS